MSNLYRYYQLVGGEESWGLCYDSDDLSIKKPTFVTVLALDTILTKDSPKELKDKAKYQGPMYFDLDADDIGDSISGAKELLKKLFDRGLTASDFQIYLSGKKGLHFLIPQLCFMQKPQPLAGLPAIYKELAFSMAVDTMDFRVYTAKMGRMFRTCYNQRDNGNYKVPISAEELQGLTSENYSELCKAPRETEGFAPKFCTGMALAFDSAAQKVGKTKPRVSKPTAPIVIQQTLPIFGKIVSAEAPLHSGFNNIAMQLSLFAREAGWDEDSFIARCENLTKNHVSDGSRYNTPRKREHELRRMFNYVADNTSLEYSLPGLKALLGKEQITEDNESRMELSAGITKGLSCYLASKGEDGEVPISNFVFHDVIQLIDRSGRIMSIRAGLSGKGIGDFAPTAFTSSSGIQNSISPYGGTFTGSDVHARGVYQIMLKEVNQRRFIIDSEGVNLVKFHIDGSAHEYVVWADRHGVKCAYDLAAQGLGLEFQGYPDPNGVTKTDLLAAKDIQYWQGDETRKGEFVECLTSLLHSHTPEVMGKMVGWSIACFYKPIFTEQFGKFPLLHVYGPAGNGKTEQTIGLMRLFFSHNDAKTITPGSTPFAVQTNMAGSASIPVVLDEYKPHTMAREKLEMFRAILRDSYNSKEVQRGGGNKSSDKYNALNVSILSAPLAFIAEAPETETAIVERSVMVSFKRLSGRQMATAFRNAMVFYNNTAPLSSVGLEVANTVVGSGNREALLKDFEVLLAWANKKYLTQPDDYEKYENGELSESELKLKAMMRPRNVYNATVACFGLSVLKKLLIKALGEEAYVEHFQEIFTEMSRAVFLGMDTLADATVPEYIKVLQVLSDMSRLPQHDQYRLVDREDYSLVEFGGKTAVVLAARNSYRKYRAYMRYTDTAPLYPSESAFELALRDVPQFLRQSAKTERLDTPSIVLDYEALVRGGVPKFSGKLVTGDFLLS